MQIGTLTGLDYTHIDIFTTRAPTCDYPAQSKLGEEGGGAGLAPPPPTPIPWEPAVQPHIPWIHKGRSWGGVLAPSHIFIYYLLLTSQPPPRSTKKPK